MIRSPCLRRTSRTALADQDASDTPSPGNNGYSVKVKVSVRQYTRSGLHVSNWKYISASHPLPSPPQSVQIELTSIQRPSCKFSTDNGYHLFQLIDCQRGIPLDSREAKEIINTVHHLTWESAEEFDRNFVISKIYKVENQVLEREFQTKRTELRDEGRSTKELSKHYAFKAEHYCTTVKKQCMQGVYCNDSNSVLGDGKMGVSVWKCPDLCLKTLKWPDTWTVCLIVFRVSTKQYTFYFIFMLCSYYSYPKLVVKSWYFILVIDCEREGQTCHTPTT